MTMNKRFNMIGLIANFENISCIVPVFLLLTLRNYTPAGKDSMYKETTGQEVST